MLSESEKQELHLQRSEAKVRLKEIWQTICQLKKLLRSYEGDHRRWKERFETADYKLAVDEKLRIIPTRQRKEPKSEEVIVKLTNDQILKIAEELGVDISEDLEKGGN